MRRGEGPKPYGTDARFPEEKLGIIAIVGMHERGLTMRAIAEAMDQGEWRLRRGGKWNPGQVWRILRRAKKRGASGQG